MNVVANGLYNINTDFKLEKKTKPIRLITFSKGDIDDEERIIKRLK